MIFHNIIISLFNYFKSKLKSYIKFIFIVLLASCDSDSKKSNLELSNFIKPQYSFKESSYNCRLLEGQTLNSVERFIPKFINSFEKMKDNSEELYFLFPVKEETTETQSFDLLLKHNESTSLDKFNLTLAALNFNEIATCNDSIVSSNSLRLTNQINSGSPVISEILQCEYVDGFNYATMKLVLEQFTDALIKHNSPVDVLYSEQEDMNDYFKWTNIFVSLESRRNFVESWQALEVSKEIQGLLLEQSICQSSKTYRQYKVF